MGTYKVYVIRAAGTRSMYVGKTNDLTRRLRQHNGEISGGARATSRLSGWEYELVIDGFATDSHAMQAEWRVKRERRRARGDDPLAWLAGCVETCFSRGRGWTSRSPAAAEQRLTVMSDVAGPPPPGWPPHWGWRELTGGSASGCQT